jgi:hypothetical protein
MEPVRPSGSCGTRRTRGTRKLATSSAGSAATAGGGWGGAGRPVAGGGVGPGWCERSAAFECEEGLLGCARGAVRCMLGPSRHAGPARAAPADAQRPGCCGLAAAARRWISLFCPGREAASARGRQPGQSTGCPPRQWMNHFALGVSAPAISSSVVTMPGDRLCTPTCAARQRLDLSTAPVARPGQPLQPLQPAGGACAPARLRSVCVCGGGGLSHPRP